MKRVLPLFVIPLLGGSPNLPERVASGSPAKNPGRSQAAPNEHPSICNPHLKIKHITKTQAIKIAEEYIALNGYTDLPPTRDKSQLTPESVWGGTDSIGLKMRHNTLEHKAYALRSGGRYKDGWTVVFRYNPDNPQFRKIIPHWDEQVKKVGRAVTMDGHGDDLRIEHQDFNLTFRGLEKVSH